jgi:hypothetical protein
VNPGRGKIPRRKAMRTKKTLTMISAEELSLILEVSEFTVKKLAKSKELPCTYVNRKPKFNIADILKHFNKLEGGAA